MAHRAGLGYSQATDLADAIMLSTGLPYETAHRVVGHLVSTAIADEVPAEQFSVTMIDQAAQAVVGHHLILSPDLLAEVLDPHAIVATRTGLGGAAPAPMRAMIAECRDCLSQTQTWRDGTERRLQDAELKLVSLARRLVESAPTDGGDKGGLRGDRPARTDRHSTDKTLEKNLR
jgi:argininosuccinate lyase